MYTQTVHTELTTRLEPPGESTLDHACNSRSTKRPTDNTVSHYRFFSFFRFAMRDHPQTLDLCRGILVQPFL